MTYRIIYNYNSNRIKSIFAERLLHMEAIYGWGQPILKKVSKMGSTSRFFSIFGKGPDRITVDDLIRMMERGERLTLLDVRPPDEHAQGHIPGSILTSASNLRCMEEYSYEGKIVLYCTAGVRSYMVSKALAARGIKGVVDLIGGIKAWEAAGGRVV